MKRALVFLSFALTLHAQLLDRMVAVVDGHIITASDVRQEREISMRLGDKPIEDDKALVQHMIDNYLIETQIADFPGVDVTDADVASVCASISSCDSASSFGPRMKIFATITTMFSYRRPKSAT